MSHYTLVTLSTKHGIKPGAKNSWILIAILLTYCVTNTSVRNGLRALSWVLYRDSVSTSSFQTLCGWISHCVCWVYTSRENTSGKMNLSQWRYFSRKKGCNVHLHDWWDTEIALPLLTEMMSTASDWAALSPDSVVESRCFQIRGVSTVSMSVQCLFLPKHKKFRTEETESNLSYNNQHLDSVEVFQTCISIIETCPTA